MTQESHCEAYIKGNEITMWKRLVYSYVYCCAIYSSQNVEMSKVSTDKEYGVDNGILLTI